MSKKHKLCPLPWIHLSTHPIGEVSVCCRADMDSSSGHARNEGDGKNLNLNENSIKEIRNSDHFKHIRQKMLAGEAPEACRSCFEEEAKGLESKRLRELHDYPLAESAYREMTGPKGEVKTPLQFVELRLGNKCNLKCITCNPTSSSPWVKDAKALENDYQISLPHDYTSCSQELFNWTEDENFWQQILEHREELNQISINGGEPTLIKKHWPYLRELIDSGHAQNIHLHYNINLTHIPSELLNLWKEFKDPSIQISIDDVGERNDLIRFPSKWKTIEKNFQKLLEYNFDVGVVQTISCLNFFTLPALTDWVRSLSPNMTIYYNPVNSPSYFSPLIIPSKDRKRAIKRMFDKIDLKNHQLLFMKYYNDESWTEERQKFLEMMNAMDHLRGTNFRNVLPELSQSL